MASLPAGLLIPVSLLIVIPIDSNGRLASELGQDRFLFRFLMAPRCCAFSQGWVN